MIILAVAGGVIVAGLAWSGVDDYRRRRRDGRPSVAEAFQRQQAIDGQKIEWQGEPGSRWRRRL